MCRCIGSLQETMIPCSLRCVRRTRWHTLVTWCSSRPPPSPTTSSPATSTAARPSPKPCGTCWRSVMTALDESKSTTDKDKERKPGKARERAGRIWGARTALTAWLGRPLASFHLLLAICALLIVIGLVMVLSASAVISINQGSSAYTVFGKQVVFVLVGLT